MLVRFSIIAMALLLSSGVAVAQTQQEKDAARIATREKLRQLLTASGPKKGIEISFRQSDKQPFNFVGIKRGLTNADSLEVVIGVTADETIGFRIYPYISGNYVNVNRSRNSLELMRKLLNFSDHNFLYWGIDDTGDIFAGYTFTLESGFPEKAIEVVLYSIAPLDPYVGQIRQFMNVTPTAPTNTSSGHERP